MSIQGVGMGQGYNVMNQTLNMTQNRVQESKNLTEDIVGGALNKQMKHQQNMLQVNAQMQAGMDNIAQQQNLINYLV